MVVWVRVVVGGVKSREFFQVPLSHNKCSLVAHFTFHSATRAAMSASGSSQSSAASSPAPPTPFEPTHSSTLPVTPPTGNHTAVPAASCHTIEALPRTTQQQGEAVVAASRTAKPVRIAQTIAKPSVGSNTHSRPLKRRRAQHGEHAAEALANGDANADPLRMHSDTHDVDTRCADLYYAARARAPRAGCGTAPLQWMTLSQMADTLQISRSVLASWADKRYIAVVRPDDSVNTPRLVHLENVLSFLRECVVRSSSEGEVDEALDAANTALDSAENV